MTKEDTTNSRTLGKWIRRVLGIEQDLKKSHDIAKLRKLETVVAHVAERFTSTETDQQEESISQITPKIYRERKEILSKADKSLDDIQPPPQGHSEAMQKAMANDERALGSILKDLTQAGDGFLKEVSEVLPNAKRSEERKLCQNISLGNLESQSPLSASSRTYTLRDEERVYEELEQKLAQYKQGKGKSSILIGVADMESESEGSRPHLIPLDHTFGALAERLTNYDSESFLPDFWSKEVNATRNCITESGVWWEWQDPSKKVNDVIKKEGHIGIETVCKEVEYLVVLVKKGDIENGMPIEIPRTCRQPAFQHLQQHFPNHIVSQVLRLQEGEDASDVVFDNRSFRHKTNPLFVKLELSAEIQPTSPVVGEVDMAQTGIDKGKGRAVDG